MADGPDLIPLRIQTVGDEGPAEHILRPQGNVLEQQPMRDWIKEKSISWHVLGFF